MFKKFNNIAAFLMMAAMLFSTVSVAFAAPEEGMFTPDQISKLDLQKKGLKIKPSDIYNPNGVDISDAVVRLSIGCTAEFVSPKGLILTNHHCAYDALVSASSTAQNYAQIGYRAAAMANELPAKDYKVFITNRVENVTAKVMKGAENMTGEQYAAKIKENIETLKNQEEAKVDKKTTEILIQPLNDGFYYFLYERMAINDVRVVYAPPREIGIYGGDPDNFQWSRHTGDFTFLRAYVAPDGSPAEYSVNNVPYQPKKHLTISLNGLDTNDFVFVLGYPGGTTRYRESQAVDYAQQVNSEFLAEYLRALSDALNMVAAEDEEKAVSLASDIASVDNGRKLYEGGTTALNRADEASKRREQEAKFAEFVNSTPQRRAEYGELLPNLKRISGTYYATSARDRILRTFPSAAYTPVFSQVLDAVVAVRDDKELTDKKRTEITQAYTNREPVIEREMIKFFLKSMAELPENQKFPAVEKLFERYKGKERREAEESIAEEISENKEFDTAEELIKLYDKSLKDFRERAPRAVDLLLAIADERAKVITRFNNFNTEIGQYRRQYQKGMAEMNKGKVLYPDANSTLRFTYGKVEGYSPREAVDYKPFTTIQGMLEKETGEYPFLVPEKLKILQANKDFGRYGENGEMPVNYLASTDIIGGNSGSPMLNAYGEQVGLVFDGNYEGLGNDIFYDKNYGRTIAVDIRYVLFVTEKFADAKWIVDEMTIKQTAAKTRRKR